MTTRRVKRILNEINELNKSIKILEQSGIYFHYNDENIGTIYVMMVGPEGTPYEKGFYFFKFDYPENYPMEPPKAKYFTQGTIRNVNNNIIGVRFNPNLYVDGKVCLSMLNTWSGPGWVPTNTISNVLVAIQALVLNEQPLQNEPGFENADKKEFARYNEIIQFANIKIAVLEMLDKQPKYFEVFKDKMEEIFMNNIMYYRKFTSDKNELYQNKKEKDRIIESPAYNMRFCIEYDILMNEIEKTFMNLEFSKMSVDVSNIID